MLWVAEQRDGIHRGALWIFDIEIEEMHRGRGYGKAAMLLAEGRAAWQVLAGAAGGSSWRAELAYAEAPYGVTYFVASWKPAASA